MLNRFHLLTSIMQTEKLDAIVFFGLTNIRYLSAFTGTDGVFIVSGEETVFLSDSRYEQQARQQVRADQVVCYKEKYKAVVEYLADKRYSSIGFDSAAISVAQYEDLLSVSPDSLTWTSLGKQVQALRQVKSAEELALICKAADLNKQAFDTILPLFRPGISERHIALELEFALKRLGGEANAFDFIVASGPRGAFPHGVASEKVLQEGELVTIDFGTVVDGYHSDETVTVAVGEPAGNLRQIFDIVLEAHDSAIAAVRPGMQIAALDAVARDLIAAAGFGEYFGHGLGHGVGLEIHEQPSVSSRSTEVLTEGMVITIEPGIYLPQVGGVRIEDMVVVTAAGCDILTSIPKGFRQLPA